MSEPEASVWRTAAHYTGPVTKRFDRTCVWRRGTRMRSSVIKRRDDVDGRCSADRPGEVGRIDPGTSRPSSVVSEPYCPDERRASVAPRLRSSSGRFDRASASRAGTCGTSHRCPRCPRSGTSGRPVVRAPPDRVEPLESLIDHPVDSQRESLTPRYEPIGSVLIWTPTWTLRQGGCRQRHRISDLATRNPQAQPASPDIVACTILTPRLDKENRL